MKLLITLRPGWLPGCLTDMPHLPFQFVHWSGDAGVIRLDGELTDEQMRYLDESPHVAFWRPIVDGPLFDTSEVERADSRSKMFSLISAERDRQIEKWGRRRNHRHLYWLGILMEEVGEAAQAVIENKQWEEIRKELVQVAAVAVAWMECVEDGDIVPEVSDDDAMFISYLNTEGSEGYFAKWFHSGRLGFRTGLSEWVKKLMDNAQVPVEGWRPAKKDDL